ncbi:MAG: hypothetical protein EP346_06290 [Bacteroidetes bacterium]|nr:MAG: hypothetical protein EP346_06290 [Bacteroidota bacterium]
MKKYALIFGVVFGFLSSHSADAQAYGYLGKKDILFYQANVWNNYLGLYNVGNKDGVDYTKFQLNHQVGYERVVSRKFTLLAKVGYTVSSMKPFSYFNTYDELNGEYRSYTPENDYNTPYSALEFAIGFRKYTTIYAPQGRYWGFTFAMSNVSMDFDYTNYTYQMPNGQMVSISENDAATIAGNASRIIFESGRTRIFADRFRFDLGLQFSIPLNSYGYKEVFNHDPENQGISDINSPDQLIENSENTLVGSHLKSMYIMVHMSLAFLP